MGKPAAGPPRLLSELVAAPAPGARQVIVGPPGHLTQKAHICYNYGIKTQQAMLLMLLGIYNSVLVVYTDPLGSHQSDYTSRSLQSVRTHKTTCSDCCM